MKSRLTKLALGLSGLLLLLLGSGCAGPKIAADLLAEVPRNDAPLVEESARISVGINPDINNGEKLDASVKQSLELALENANIFGFDMNQTYRIEAYIQIASQAAMSFGSFEGKMEIRYRVYDAENNEVMDETVYTEAGSDKFSFYGAKRHRRSRAVNISKNVLEFVDLLQAKLEQR